VNGLKWIIVALALLEAGYMAFDGTRALVVGDYITPASGEFAGQLGPWANLIAAIGIEPRSTLMKALFAIYGATWLAITIAFVARPARVWWAMLIAAAGALWYLWIGTVASALQIVLLILFRARQRNA
jgi:hypothetical protein